MLALWIISGDLTGGYLRLGVAACLILDQGDRRCEVEMFIIVS